jgi:tripartite-type tricarboxylate transporter receptor subunit TctC
VLSVLQALPHLQAKTIKPLAVTSAKASDILPNVPALAEAGLKDYEAELWYVVIAPTGLSPELTQRINSQIVKIVKSPEMQKKLADQGARLVGSTPAETAAFMKAESDKWGKVIKEANIKGE